MTPLSMTSLKCGCTPTCAANSSDTAPVGCRVYCAKHYHPIYARRAEVCARAVNICTVAMYILTEDAPLLVADVQQTGAEGVPARGWGVDRCHILRGIACVDQLLHNQNHVPCVWPTGGDVAPPLNPRVVVYDDAGDVGPIEPNKGTLPRSVEKFPPP